MREIIIKLIKENVPIQNTWVTVISVDWDAKTMECEGISDELEYFDVLLGIGSTYYKPVENTKCLIGTIDNKEASSFLIMCEQFEECLIADKSGFKWNLNKGKLTINGDGFGGLVKAPELKKQVDKNSAILNAILQVFQTPVNEPGNGAPSVLQVALMTATTGKKTADLSNIENNKIKHGG